MLMVMVVPHLQQIKAKVRVVFNRLQLIIRSLAPPGEGGPPVEKEEMFENKFSLEI